MEITFRDQLAASCPHFVRMVVVQQSRDSPELGAEYYFIKANYRLTKIGCSIPNGSHGLKYIADTGFVKKYCCIFELGDVLMWDEYEGFKSWSKMMVAQKPKFVDPYKRTTFAFSNGENYPQELGRFENLIEFAYIQNYIFDKDQKEKIELIVYLFVNAAYHLSWFLAPIGATGENMTVTIPKNIRSFFFAPNEAVAIVHSGNRRWYVKIKGRSLTDGWNEVASAHNLQPKYVLLFACVGHLQFDLFIFDEDGYEMNYKWSSILPIEEPNAPIGWNAEEAMCKANKFIGLTACPPISFRAAKHALRCAIILRFADLQNLEMPARFRSSFQVQHCQKLTLIIKGRTWDADYRDDHLTGYEWLQFVATHQLQAGDVLILSPDANMKLHAMVICCNNYERVFEWY